jgi:hypothetical protein
LKKTISNSATKKPSIIEHTKPVRESTGLSYVSEKYTRTFFYPGFYSLDDVVIRSSSEVREIANRIIRQPQASTKLGNSDAVSAPADIRDPDLIEESQGDQHIG